MDLLKLRSAFRPDRRRRPVTWSRLGRRWRDLALLLATLGPAALHAQDDGGSIEYRVKAAYLLNFTRYVEWPDSAFATAGASLDICVLGRDPFGEDLDQVTTNRTSQGHPIRVRRARDRSELAGCHLVFVSEQEWRRNPEAPAHLTTRGVLTVGDTEEFAREGGVIGFVIREETVRFVVNLDARDRAGLRISSRVLALANNLITSPGPRF